MTDLFCGGCRPNPVRSECKGSFGRAGILKAHWECWSNCNLSCGFCYRTRGAPLETSPAKRLLLAVRSGGCKAIVFAGGDPSLRADIGELVETSRELGLQTEIQTNADYVPVVFRRALQQAELVGLSLDAAEPGVHDGVRGKVGNFQRTLDLLRWLEETGKPTVVRSVVLPQNIGHFRRVAQHLSSFTNIVRWSLLEFSPIGDGFRNQERFRCDPTDFERAAAEAIEGWRGSGAVDIYRNSRKSGTYLLLTPAGLVYGTSRDTVAAGVFPTVGSILTDHLEALVQALPFSAERHHERYAGLLHANQPKGDLAGK